MTKSSTTNREEKDGAIAAGQKREKKENDQLEQLNEVIELCDDQPKSHLTRAARDTWKYILAISACAEFLAFIIPVLLKSEEEEVVTRKSKLDLLMFWKNNDIELVVEQCVDGFKCMLENSVHWFENNKEFLGSLFCLLWVVDAIRSAFDACRQVTREIEYERLQKSEQEKKINTNSLVDDSSPWLVFTYKLLFRLSLLPVSFFLLNLNKIGFIDPNKQFGENSQDYEELEEKYSLFYAIFAKMFAASVIFVQSTVKSKVVRVGKTALAKISKRAIRNPRKFRRDMKKLLTVLRWVKYLAPLIGTANKLLGNTIDMVKKMKQKLEAEKARRVRNKIWKKMSKEEREINAAKIIQATFRSKRCRKTVTLMRIFISNKQESAVLKLQKRLRERAQEASARLKQKKDELTKLRKREMQRETKGKNGAGVEMSDDDKKRMYDLHATLKKEALSEKAKKMLLRPNTKFAVTWKILFVFCVAVEITQLALKPKLERMKDKTTKTPLDLGKILNQKLVPTPISAWEECAQLYMEENDDDDDNSNLKLRLKQIFGNPDKLDDTFDSHEDYPWYCQKIIVTAQSIYIEALQFVLFNFFLFIGIICFLDVFVTFFTGEISAANGNLVAKPFFPRWILPGIVLQILVNPKMADVSILVKKVIKGVHHVGPARAARWIIAFIAPVLQGVTTWFEWNVWMKLVQRENLNKK